MIWAVFSLKQKAEIPTEGNVATHRLLGFSFLNFIFWLIAIIAQPTTRQLFCRI